MSRNVRIALGLVLTVAGYVVLYQAYEGSGGRKPIVLGPFLPW
jgi:hypothetical protein